MTQKSVLVQKDIKIMVTFADSGNEIFSTKIPIDKEQILQLVSRNGVFKVETSLPITQIEGTKFAFDEERVYYDDKACVFPRSQSIIAVALFKAYHNNSGPLTTKDLLQILKDSKQAIREGTFTRSLTNIRNTLGSVTGDKEHNFIPNERYIGYRFDPIF